MTATSRSAANGIEDVLREHPDVMDAALIEEEGIDGQRYQVAYVVPHIERMKAAKSRIYVEDRDKRIAQWRKAFDQAYRFGGENNSPNFVGWTSNFTNKPIPQIEMQEWLDRTVERILALKPRRLLEIGCGVGLLVERLAPSCLSYCGTDLSPIAVGRLREFVARQPELCHVELREREATNFDDLEPGSVDTVVLNSVAQYFPDADYLRAVLDGAAKVVAPGGHIFVGDLRHLGLLPTFHGAVQLAKAPARASVRWLKRRVSLAIEQERELVIDPQFFLALRDSIPGITGVEILLKRDVTNNELSRYRYDVLLHVGGSQPSASEPATEWQAADAELAELISRFDAGQLSAVRILDVPNKRVAGDLAAVQLLWSADDSELVGDLRDRIPRDVDAGQNPETFWRLSDRDYDVRVGSSPHSADGSFDVALARRGQRTPSLERIAAHSGRGPLATDPMAAAYLQQLGLELGKILQERLPEALVPAAVLALHEMPVGRVIESPGIAAEAPLASVLGADRGQLVQE